MSLRILFKLTTRQRLEKAQRTIDSINNNATDTNYHILVSVDEDDDTWKQLKGFHHVCVGQSKNKIDAINRDVNEYGGDWDILVNVSDDQVFIMKGFDAIIRGNFFYHNPDSEIKSFEEAIKPITLHENLDLFLHFPDGNRNDLATMSIMGRDYYERDKYIYNPIYANEYCDNEAQEVAKTRGCYKYVDVQIFDHLHGNYGKGDFDQLHKINEQKGLLNYDAMRYQERLLNNFGL